MYEVCHITALDPQSPAQTHSNNADYPGWQVHAVQQQPSAAVLPLPHECSTLHCLPLPSGVHRPP